MLAMAESPRPFDMAIASFVLQVVVGLFTSGSHDFITPFHLPPSSRPCRYLTFKKVSGETKQGEEKRKAREMCVPPRGMDRLV